MRKKPQIKYTEMCIYIDAHIHEPDHDVEKIFDYLQCLFYALAAKKRWFKKEEDYDKYSLYSAVQVYQRLVNPKLQPIKSVLNYIKKVMYPFRINYQQDNFYQIYCDEKCKNTIEKTLKDDNISKAYQESAALITTDITLYFNSITSVIKNFLNESPYSNDKVMLKNIYISCLLTLLRSITISNANEKRIHQQDISSCYKPNIDTTLEKIYYEEALEAPTVWHLDPGLTTYIAVVTNKIKKLIAQDIRDVMKIHEPSEDIIMDMLMTPMVDNLGGTDG